MDKKKARLIVFAVVVLAVALAVLGVLIFGKKNTQTEHLELEASAQLEGKLPIEELQEEQTDADSGALPDNEEEAEAAGNILNEGLAIGGVNTEARALLQQINEAWLLDEKYALEPQTVDGIYMEWLHEKEKTSEKAILMLHGGAYIRALDYNGATYRRIGEQYAKISGASVLIVDYRIAPENPYPAALEDALLGYKWLLDNGYKGEDIIIAGDSAGGGLTLAVALYLRDNEMPLPAALVTMSAWTNLDYPRMKVAYVGDENSAKNPYISPVYAEFSGLPPILMQVGTRDILQDTLTVAQLAEAAGVTVQQTTYDKMFHVFQALFPQNEDSNKAWDEVEAFIKAIYAQQEE